MNTGCRGLKRPQTTGGSDQVGVINQLLKTGSGGWETGRGDQDVSLAAGGSSSAQLAASFFPPATVMESCDTTCTSDVCVSPSHSLTLTRLLLWDRWLAAASGASWLMLKNDTQLTHKPKEKTDLTLKSFIFAMGRGLSVSSSHWGMSLLMSRGYAQEATERNHVLVATVVKFQIKRNAFWLKLLRLKFAALWSWGFRPVIIPLLHSQV